MRLTKKDKEEIKKIVREAMLENNAVGTKSTEMHNVTPTWREKCVKSELTGLVVAPEDLAVTLPDGTEKAYFTFDEAIKYTKDLPDGWRLPTRSEWALLAEEFGNDPKTGSLDGNKFADALGLEPHGWLDSDGDKHGVGYYGYYWSSVVYGGTGGYYLYFDGDGYLGPQGSTFRYRGNSVRCVAR